MKKEQVIVNCPKCGADIKIESKREYIFCSECGEKIFLKSDLIEDSTEEAASEEGIDKDVINKSEEFSKFDISLFIREIIAIVAWFAFAIIYKNKFVHVSGWLILLVSFAISALLYTILVIIKEKDWFSIKEIDKDYEAEKVDTISERKLIRIRNKISELILNKKKYLIIGLGIIILIGSIIIMIVNKEKINPKIEIPYTTENVVGQQYKDVVKNLDDVGYSNVSTEAIKVSNYEELQKAGQVISLSINGTEKFRLKKYRSNTPIIVTYYSDEYTSVGEDASNLVGKKIEDVKKVFSKNGFSSVKVEAIIDENKEFEQGTVKEVTIGSKSDFKLRDVYKKNSKVVIKYYIHVSQVQLDISIDRESFGNKEDETYEIMVSIDDKRIDEIALGDNKTLVQQLSTGKHTIKFVQRETFYSGTASLVVEEPTSVKYYVSRSGGGLIVNVVESKKTPANSEELIGKKFNEVKKIFTDAGFAKITKKPIEDLNGDQEDQKNRVKEVKVGNNSIFTTNSIAYTNDEVQIAYHTFKKVNVPIGTGNYETYVANLKSLGFVNITLIPQKSSPGWLHDDQDVYSVTSEGKIVEGMDITVDKEIIVTYYQDEKVTYTGGSSNNSSETDSKKEDDNYDVLESYDALAALEDYANTQCVDSISLHKIGGVITNQQREDGSFYVVCMATGKKGGFFGKKYDCTVEGVVSGTISRPIVTNFLIY